MASSKVSALTELSVPDLADIAYIVDDPAGTPLSRKISLNRLLAIYQTCEGRLTLATGESIYNKSTPLTPSAANATTDIVTFASAHGWATGTVVIPQGTGIAGLSALTTYYVRSQSSTTISLHTTASLAHIDGAKVDITSSTLTTASGITIRPLGIASVNLYFTPHDGNKIALYDGTRWKVYAFTERTLDLSAAVGGGNMTADRNYDVFLYDNSGTLTLELSAAWNADGVTRTDALTTQDGVIVKSGAATRRWLGIIRATSATTTEDSEFQRFVLNGYNQYPRQSFRCPGYINNGANFSYSHAASGGAASGWTRANNGNGSRIAYLSDGRNPYRVGFHANASNTFRTGIAEDWTSNTSPPPNIVASAAATTNQSADGSHSSRQSEGYHYLDLMVWASATATTYVADNARGTTALMDTPVTYIEAMIMT